MFPLGFCDISDRLAHILLKVCLTVYTLHDQTFGVAPNPGLNYLEPSISFFRFLHEGPPQLWVLHFFNLFFLAASSHCPPSRGGVIKVPMLQCECEAGAPGSTLSVNRQSSLAAILNPPKRTPMNFGVLSRWGYHVMKNWPLGDACKLFQKGYVGTDIARTLSDLDKPLVAIRQNPRQVENIFIAHDVCDHRRTIEIRLNTVGPEALNRETAEPSVHTFMQ